MKTNNCLASEAFVDGEIVDKVLCSVRSYKDVAALCGRIKNPESLKKRQRTRLIRRLIEFSKTYDEILMIKDFYAEVLAYSLTDRQVCHLIEKLVWASSNDQELKEVKKYATSKGFLSRYMRILFNRRIADVLSSS